MKPLWLFLWVGQQIKEKYQNYKKNSKSEWLQKQSPHTKDEVSMNIYMSSGAYKRKVPK